MDPLQEAWRIAAWAPDLARELLIATVGGDEQILARTQECLGKVFAVTGAWELARASYTGAAVSWEPLDPARAGAFRATAERLPIAPFVSDRDAVAADLDLVVRCVAGDVPATRRLLVEIRRALQPALISAQIEAAFGLAPEDHALMMAAVASIAIPDQVPRKTADEWHAILAPSQFGRRGSVNRLVHHGLCAVTPELVPHASVVSRLLGRRELDHPQGIRLDPIGVPVHPVPVDSALVRSLVTTRGIAVIFGEPHTGRHTWAAAIGQQCGRSVFAMRPAAGADSADFASVAVEAALHGGMLAIDLDDWSARGIQLPELAGLLGRASMFVISRSEAAIPVERRAFTLQTSR